MKTKYFGLLLTAFALSLLGFSVSAQSEGTTPLDSRNIVELINAERSANKLPPLSEDARLDLAAQLKLDDMVSNNYFQHISPQGKSPWFFVEEAGYRYSSAGENLAMDYKNPEQLTLAWMQSAEHKQNLLNPGFTQTGFAEKEVVYNGQLTNFIVELFGNAKHTELTERN